MSDPKSTAPLMAPNMMSQVQQTIDSHPEIDSMNEETRGEIIDITDWRVNGGVDRPWGRKARQNNPSDPQLNTDGMTYLRPDGLFEIYDCISGTNGQATWDGYGPFAQGENGYWWPPQPVEESIPVPPPVDNSVKDSEQDERIGNLEMAVSALDQRLTDMQNMLAGGLRAHGPVDLPLVVESLTRMRAKGDIDVQVVGGVAIPPTPSSEEVTLVDIIALKKLINRP